MVGLGLPGVGRAVVGLGLRVGRAVVGLEDPHVEEPSEEDEEPHVEEPSEEDEEPSVEEAPPVA